MLKNNISDWNNFSVCFPPCFVLPDLNLQTGRQINDHKATAIEKRLDTGRFVVAKLTTHFEVSDLVTRVKFK